MALRLSVLLAWIPRELVVVDVQLKNKQENRSIMEERIKTTTYETKCTRKC